METFKKGLSLSVKINIVIVLIITMMQFAYFWIANALYLSFISAAIVSSAVKLVAYRRGF